MHKPQDNNEVKTTDFANFKKLILNQKVEPEYFLTKINTYKNFETLEEI